MHTRLFFIALIFLSIPVKSQELQWKYHTGQPLMGSVVTANGNVYFGGLDSNVYCLDASSGKVVWIFRSNGDIRSAPLIINKRVYFVCGDGRLYCLDDGGKLGWTFSTRGEKHYNLFGFADYFYSAPVTDGRHIYFGSGDSSVYAIEINSGKLVWQFKTGDLVHATPCIYGNRIYIGSFDGCLYALDRRTGQQIWKFKSVGQQYFPKGEFNGSATGFGGAVYVGGRDYNFYCIDTVTGTCRWNHRFEKGWAITKPLISDSVLYIGTSDDRVFLAMDPFTGKIKWSFPAGFNVFGAPAMKDSIIYFGNMMGRLFGVRRTTGQQLLTFTTQGYHDHHEKYFKVDDTYLDNVFGTVIKRNEDFLSLYIDMGGIISTPSIYKQLMIFTSMDGNVYAVSIP